MESPHTVYNQAGPSNFPIPYAQEGRPPPHYNGRGRGHTGHRHANVNYHHAQQQQPFYVPGTPTSYAGYSVGMNGMNGAGIQHSQQHAMPSGRRGAGPNYHATNFQAPASSVLHPVPVYSPHVSPYIVPTTVPGPAPMYHYPHTPPHVQPYPTAFSQPIHHPPYSFSIHQNMRSPLISPLPEHDLRSPRLSKNRQPPSPRPLQASAAPLPQQQKETQSPSVALNSIPEPQQCANDSLGLTEHQPNSPPQRSASSVADSSASLPSDSPLSLESSLPSFDSEPAPQQEWVISASRPDNPVAAFGIMISPKAKPPGHIVKGARKYAVHKSPKSSSVESTDTDSSSSNLRDSMDGEKETLIESQIAHPEHISGSVSESDSRASTVADTFAAGSPVSTATSMSTAPLKIEDDAIDQGYKDMPDAEPQNLTKSPKRPASEVISGATPRSDSALTGAPKSWASLLRSDVPSSSKSNLPTSHVQGFSIPASSGTKSSSVSGASESSDERKGFLRLLNNGPSAASGVPQIRPRGLVNTGNMCFANAVLQTLVYTPPFFRLFVELGKYIGGPPSNSTKERPLVNATVEFFKEFKPKSKNTSKDNYEDEENYETIDSFIPSYVYDAMKEKARFENMGGGQQEDAEEFFGFFLDTIEEELLSISKSLTDGTESKTSSRGQEDNSADGDDWMEVGKKNKPVVTRATKSVESPMTRIFGGKFRSTLRVPGQRDSVIVEDWRSLQLDIQRDQVESIEDALRCISHPQPVQMSSVTKGGAVVEASQQVLVDALPPILVLHLKRFLYDTTLKDVVKVHKQVSYGPELEIPSDAMSPARRSPHPPRYKLFSVLYHHGSSAAGGHYTLDVLHPNRNADTNAKSLEGWIRIDDELVTDLRSEEVFGKERDCAYLLFYRRIGGK